MRYLVDPETRGCFGAASDDTGEATPLPQEPVLSDGNSPNPQLLMDKWTLLRDDNGNLSLQDVGPRKVNKQWTSYLPRRRSLNQVAEAVRRAAQTPALSQFRSRLRHHWRAAVHEVNVRRDPDGHVSIALATGQDAGTLHFSLRTEWRVALHLARSNPYENASVCLHRTGGFPYFPGSGLKGLARCAALHRIAESFPELIADIPPDASIRDVTFDLDAMATDRHEEALRALARYASVYGLAADEMPGKIGDALRAQRQADEWAGGIIFWDALPIRCEVVIDVLTPHFAEYYKSAGAKSPPADNLQPVPITFLAFSGEYEFGVSAREAGAETLQKLLAAATDLATGLVTLGAGAKTAAGYGHFRPNDLGEAPQAAAPNEAAVDHREPQEWAGATLHYAPNTDLLILRFTPATQAKALQAEANREAPWFIALPDPVKKRLVERRKELKVSARVRQLGAKWVIESITLPA